MVLAMISIAALNVAPADAGTFDVSADGSSVCALGSFMSNVPGFSTDCDGGGAVYINAPTGGSAYNDRALWEIDSPSSALTITAANVSQVEAYHMNSGPGYGGGAYWNGGGVPLGTGDSVEPESFSGFSSQYFGLQLVCSDSSGCDGQGTQSSAQIVSSGSVTLTVQESQAPGLIAAGTNNLFYQGNNWVWNAPGDPWPATLQGSDPSGVCSLTVTAGSVANTVASSPNAAVFQQCPSPVVNDATVDTTSLVPTSGQFTLGLSAQNAAMVQAETSATINVDNIQPSVAIGAVNDPNPGGWSVNHSVTLHITPAAGPSGFSSFSCSDTLAGVTTPLKLAPDATSPGVYDATVDGNGSHAVACGVANNAINPQGVHNTGTAAETVDIDEQPPTISFEATNPSDPDQVIVDTSDNESPVNGGSIQITPQGSSSATQLQTTFTSSGQLMATIPDATLTAGAYTLEASATSQVGNTGSVSENLTLPLRAASSSGISFRKIVDPRIARKVKERVLVGFHYATEKKHGKTVRVKRGGHYKSITVIKRVERCSTKRVRVAKHKWKLKRTCKAPHLSYRKKTAVGHGKRTTVYGELLTSQNVPIASQTVTVLTAPSNGKRHFTAFAHTTTNSTGGWKVRLPAGPSRIVEASYGGSATQLPASSIARVNVPARILITATPTQLPWSGTTTITGRLVGGYIPSDGVAMRLLIRIAGRKQLYSPVPFRTTKTGSFSVKWSWGSGSGVVRYPFSVATTANESDYPYTAATSKAVSIEFGVRTPARPKKRGRRST